ncbi:MAG: response regulator [Vicinamibacterales bacterium]
MPKSVLLADDSLTIQRVVTLTFANEDVTITSVSDGDQAVEAIARSRPDLVLADIAMPGRTGYEVVQYVRSHPALASLPVLLLAGAFDPVDEAQARQVGADGVLTKPFEPSTLIGQVNQLLAMGRPVQSSLVVSMPERHRQVSDLALPPMTSSASPDATPAVDIAVVNGVTQSSQVPVAAEADAASVASESAPAEAASASVAVPNVERKAPVGTPATTQNFMRTLSPDSYFEQIDQAFAALAKAPRPSLNLVPKAPVEEPRDEIVASLAEATVSPVVSAPPKEAELPTRTVQLSDAFSALLDAERAGLVNTSARLTGVPATSPVDVDALAAQVARRVLEQMSDRVVRDTVSDIVTSTAERLVREEIEQVKRNIT